MIAPIYPNTYLLGVSPRNLYSSNPPDDSTVQPGLRNTGLGDTSYFVLYRLLRYLLGISLILKSRGISLVTKPIY